MGLPMRFVDVYGGLATEVRLVVAALGNFGEIQGNREAARRAQASALVRAHSMAQALSSSSITTTNNTNTTLKQHQTNTKAIPSMLKDANASYGPDLAIGSSPTESYLSNLSLAQPTPKRTKLIKCRKKNNVTEETEGEDGYDASDEAEEEAAVYGKTPTEGNGKISLLSTNKEATPYREIPEDRSRLWKRNREPEEEQDDGRLVRRQKRVRGTNVEDDDAMRMSM